ncbi:DnaB-like helicase C-terminal domain-containing protein [Thiomicrorhabdus sp. Milos-T2]|uniref:DnaB-like helicase C-terminal domain-containing protein n=1 Tax=Thiomicrorhabdus sp. Milos-T2 TaxID=90814 RepID=UPI000494707C|nr:DnaB-like helicase C-terminal domain-containing protein [Thiomicrorhabdus sp. Milos-T2]
MSTFNTEQLLENFVNDLDRRFNEEKDKNTFYTGFDALDEALWNLQGGDLVLFQGAAASGKTALAVNLLHNFSMQGASTLFVSNGDKNEEIMLKIMALNSEIDIDRLRAGRIKEEDWPKLNKAVKTFSDNWKVTIHPGKTTSLKALQELALSLELDHTFSINEDTESSVNLIVIDDLHLNKKYSTQITKSLKALKELAMTLNIPILAFSSNSKTFQKEIIEQNTYIREYHYESVLDFVDFGIKIHDFNPLPSLNSSHDKALELVITKNKRGKNAKVNLSFHSGFMKFKSLNLI